ncbi:acyl carrier protein [Streptococcus cameli]
MTSEMIFEKIQSIIHEQKGSDFVVTPELSIQDGLAADSVEVMEFVIAVEDEFGIEIPDQAIEDFHTLSDMIKHIKTNVR